MTMRLELLALAAAALLAAPTLDAQVVVAGQRSVSARVTVGLVIPPRMVTRAATAPVLVATKGDTATYRLDVQVAANLEWTLRVGAGAEAGLVRVRDEAGAWQVAGEAVTVAADQAPANWRPVPVEFQVIGGIRGAALPALSLELAPSRR